MAPNKTHNKTTKSRPANSARTSKDVIHEVTGICSLVLTHADAPLPLAARRALLKAQHTARMQCVVECDGHAFSISALPVVTFVDDIADFASSVRKTEPHG